jgi:hypothetical protein
MALPRPGTITTRVASPRLPLSKPTRPRPRSPSASGCAFGAVRQPERTPLLDASGCGALPAQAPADAWISVRIRHRIAGHTGSRSCGESRRPGSCFPRKGVRAADREIRAAEQEQVQRAGAPAPSDVLNLSSARRDRGAEPCPPWGTSGPLVSVAGCRRGPGTARRSPRGTRARLKRTRPRATSAPRPSSGNRRSRS